MWAMVQINTVKTQIENKFPEQKLFILKIFELWRIVREKKS